MSSWLALSLATCLQLATCPFAYLYDTILYSPSVVRWDIYNLSMGNAGKGQETLPASPRIQEPRELSPLERWESSEKSQQDLIALLSSSPLEECTGTVYQCLRGIAKREKYQNYLLALVEYLQSPHAVQRLPAGPRREVFAGLSRRLRLSFFVAADFPEGHLEVDVRPADQFCFLYEYYSQEDQLQRAIFFNYPSIFTGFGESVRVLVEREVLLDETQLCGLVVAARREEEMREYFEVAVQSLPAEERQGLLAEVAVVQDLKGVYLAGVEELLRYDYADAAGGVMRALEAKGHELSLGEREYWLKVEVYGVLLYELSKLSLGFDFLRGMTVGEVLHYFFANYELQETPLLVRCFGVFSDPSAEWHSRLSSYLFSPHAHFSTLTRLLQARLFHLAGTPQEFALLLGKVRGSRCEIGRYCEQLASLALSFEVDALLRTNYCRLLKLVEVYYAFGINAPVEFLYGVAFGEWSGVSEAERETMRARGVQLLRTLVEGYFRCFEVKQRRVECEGVQFGFSTLFQLLRFIQFLKRTYLCEFIAHSEAHEIFFRQLLKHQRYVEVKALVAEERAREFSIDPAAVGAMVSEHLVELLTSAAIRRSEEAVRLLLSVLGLSPSGGSWHYVLSYYHYLKYLQEREVVLPAAMKQAIATENLYFIATHYPLKLEQVDFNLLFAHQSCITLRYTDTAAAFLPVVTDDFLKFKLFLCSKAFAGKRYRLGAEVVEEVVRYEPPWIGTELVRILRENPAIDDSFIAIAFNFCARGEDLEFILSLAASRGKEVAGSSSKLSLLKLKTWASLVEEQRYLVLTDEVVVCEQYKNLVAELTFNEGGAVRSEHFLFFHLLTVEPHRAFNYALNFALPPVFVTNFLLEGLKRGVLHAGNTLPLLLKFLFFAAKREGGHPYVGLRDYAGAAVEAIAGERAGEAAGGGYASAAFERMLRNYHAQRVASREFLDLYLPPRDLFKFTYEEPFRRDVLVGLREQPMSKACARVLRALCERTGVDILQLSLYNLTARANSRNDLDDESWTIVQKLVHWGDDARVAAVVLRRLLRVESLRLLLELLDFLRECETAYRLLVTDYHLQLVRSLAAVEVNRELFGILPEDFFERAVGVRASGGRGMLAEGHRRVLRQAGSVENIFVLSKALYFLYGCSPEVEKVVLGEFSLRQPDSEEFEELRKKIKRETAA